MESHTKRPSSRSVFLNSHPSNKAYTRSLVLLSRLFLSFPPFRKYSRVNLNDEIYHPGGTQSWRLLLEGSERLSKLTPDWGDRVFFRLECPLKRNADVEYSLHSSSSHCVPSFPQTISLRNKRKEKRTLMEKKLGIPPRSLSKNNLKYNKIRGQ